VELCGEGGEEIVKLGAGAGVFGGELDAHEEEGELGVLMLVCVEDVGVVVEDEEVGDGGDDALAVGAVEEEDGCLGGGGHWGESIAV